LYSFESRTGKIQIDRSKCKDCTTFACVKSCSYYGSGILRLTGGQPELNVSFEEAKRRCNESLACEWSCEFQGQHAISIELPIPGLEIYKKQMSERRG
jgi:hypothetical protein